MVIRKRNIEYSTKNPKLNTYIGAAWEQFYHAISYIKKMCTHQALHHFDLHLHCSRTNLSKKCLIAKKSNMLVKKSKM